jgi:hypothetical protein
MLTTRLAILPGILGSAASSLLAQNTPRPAFADSSAARIMVHVGTQPEAPWFRDILRQKSASYPQAKLDELADSLVSRANDPRAIQTDTSRYRAAGAGVGVLVLAGSRAALGGKPYAGAAARLIQIHRAAPDLSIRREALGGLLSGTDRAQALQYLRDDAESNDETASSAVEFLIIDANGDGIGGIPPTAAQSQASATVLRELASRGRVTKSTAVYLLKSWIAAHP